jgi:hypothetical protein
MTDRQDMGPERPTGPHGEHRTGAETQAEESATEAADAAARSGSPDAPVPDDAISAAAARVGADRGGSVRESGTWADAPPTEDPVADTGARREVTDTGDTERRQ